MTAYNRSAATFFLKLAEHQEEGELYSSMASLVFSAFTFEAFMNYLGLELKMNDPEFERMTADDKLRALAVELDFKPSRKTRPYSTLTPLFKFRNAIAHGRTEQQHVKQVVDPQWTALQMVKSLENDWEKYCSKANARKAYDDICKIASELCQRANLASFPGFPFGVLSGGIYHATAK